MTGSREPMDIESNEEKPIMHNLRCEPRITSLTSMKNGDLICGYTNGKICFLDEQFEEYKSSRIIQKNAIYELAVLNDHQIVTMDEESNQINIHHLKDKNKLICLEHSPNNQFEELIILNRKRLIVAAEVNDELTLKIWNEHGYLLDVDLPKHAHIPASTPEGNLIFSVSQDTESESQLYIWNSTQNTLTHSVKLAGYVFEIVPVSEELVFVVIPHYLILVDIKNHIVLDTQYEKKRPLHLHGLPNGMILLHEFSYNKMAVLKNENNKIKKLQSFDVDYQPRKVHILPNGHIAFAGRDRDVVSFEIPCVTKEMVQENEFKKVRTDTLIEFFPPVIENLIIQYDTRYDNNRFFPISCINNQATATPNVVPRA